MTYRKCQASLMAPTAGNHPNHITTFHRDQLRQNIVATASDMVTGKQKAGGALVGTFRPLGSLTPDRATWSIPLLGFDTDGQPLDTENPGTVRISFVANSAGEAGAEIQVVLYILPVGGYTVPVAHSYTLVYRTAGTHELVLPPVSAVSVGSEYILHIALVHPRDLAYWSVLNTYSMESPGVESYELASFVRPSNRLRMSSAVNLSTWANRQYDVVLEQDGVLLDINGVSLRGNTMSTIIDDVFVTQTEEFQPDFLKNFTLWRRATPMVRSLNVIPRYRVAIPEVYPFVHEYAFDINRLYGQALLFNRPWKLHNFQFAETLGNNTEDSATSGGAVTRRLLWNSHNRNEREQQRTVPLGIIPAGYEARVVILYKPLSLKQWSQRNFAVQFQGAGLGVTPEASRPAFPRIELNRLEFREIENNSPGISDGCRMGYGRNLVMSRGTILDPARRCFNPDTIGSSTSVHRNDYPLMQRLVTDVNPYPETPNAYALSAVFTGDWSDHCFITIVGWSVYVRRIA